MGKVLVNSHKTLLTITSVFNGYGLGGRKGTRKSQVATVLAGD